MSQAKFVELLQVKLEAQPHDLRGHIPDERDALIVTLVQIEGTWTVLSHYGDNQWLFIGGPSNTPANARNLDFTRVPTPFRASMKAIMYRYLHRGRAGQKRPKFSTVRGLFDRVQPFLLHLQRLKLQHFGAVTPLVCAVYVHEAQAARIGKKAKPLAAATLSYRFSAVNALHELSQYTDDPMPAKPWSETSANIMLGLTGRNQPVGTTPLIPDSVFTKLFQAAWKAVEQGPKLLDLRDALDGIEAERLGQDQHTINNAKNRRLHTQGRIGGLSTFTSELQNLRTACYIVVASLSGCRSHELSYIQTDACYRTQDDSGDNYWWMKSHSTKTDAGHTEWMIPEAAVTALRIMDRWARPYQAMIKKEIARRRVANPVDPEIAEAQNHLGAVFLGVIRSKRNGASTLSRNAWGLNLKAFAKKHSIDWNLASHQFRRKFANYVARSQFGDLRYLKEHFKHWSMDMTLGYALNESQEMALYAEIQNELDDIKDEVVEQWLQPDEPLAGGYGRGIMAWRGSEAVTLCKNHSSMVRSVSESSAIRSNGHAWCTADDNLCVGNGGLDRTRCTGCNNAVIGREHAHIYQGMYDQLNDVLKCDDIGEGGLARVRRDLDRCRDVLTSLGYDPVVQA